MNRAESSDADRSRLQRREPHVGRSLPKIRNRCQRFANSMIFQETRRGFLQLKMYADSDAACDQFFPSEVITDNNPHCARRKYRWLASPSGGKPSGKPFPISSRLPQFVCVT